MATVTDILDRQLLVDWLFGFYESEELVVQPWSSGTNKAFHSMDEWSW